MVNQIPEKKAIIPPARLAENEVPTNPVSDVQIIRIPTTNNNIKAKQDIFFIKQISFI